MMQLHVCASLGDQGNQWQGRLDTSMLSFDYVNHGGVGGGGGGGWDYQSQNFQKINQKISHPPLKSNGRP